MCLSSLILTFCHAVLGLMCWRGQAQAHRWFVRKLSGTSLRFRAGPGRAKNKRTLRPVGRQFTTVSRCGLGRLAGGPRRLGTSPGTSTARTHLCPAGGLRTPRADGGPCDCPTPSRVTKYRYRPLARSSIHSSTNLWPPRCQSPHKNLQKIQLSTWLPPGVSPTQSSRGAVRGCPCFRTEREWVRREGPVELKYCAIDRALERDADCR
jgi:hypothetical protein